MIVIVRKRLAEGNWRIRSPEMGVTSALVKFLVLLTARDGVGGGYFILLFGRWIVNMLELLVVPWYFNKLLKKEFLRRYSGL
jgi:hypothetical protein